MQGMSSMGKPQRPGTDVRAMLLGPPKQSQIIATKEFTCTCSTGWAGPTCEISKIFNWYFVNCDILS